MSHDYSGFGFTPGDFSSYSSASNDRLLLLICRLVPELTDVWNHVLVDYLGMEDEHLKHQMSTIERWKVEWRTAVAWSQWSNRFRCERLYETGGRDHEVDRLMKQIRALYASSTYVGVAATTLARHWQSRRWCLSIRRSHHLDDDEEEEEEEEEVGGGSRG